MKSVLQKEKRSYRCGSPYVEEHHIFFGTSNRRQSEKYGLKIWLCPAHHRETPEAPHQNRKIDLAYKGMAQKYFESHLESREKFREIFGRSYL